MELTIVIPVYNSEKTISPLVERLHDCLSALLFEVILVNDGSADQSGLVIDQLADRYPTVRAISLRRNFGEFNAVLCGLSYARGQFTAIIDDDFQNPPEAILTLLGAAQAGQYDVVYSRYATKQHHWFRNLGSQLVNALTTASLGKPRDLYLSSFKLIRREVVAEIVRYQGPYPYIDGLIFRVTRHVTSVEVPHLARSEGQSGYTARKLIGLFLNVFIGYSLWPVRLFTGLGLGILLLAGLSGLGLLIAGLAGGAGIAGWLVVSWLIVFGLGIQLVFLGVLGEYLGKLFMSQSGLPAFVVRSNKAGKTLQQL
ncbi:glycosyltransferase family 2 protein [Spirosoma rhododendri]|uniref:Glycosyltransferase family 2 protein n=1 Tax=Spirosoma rhododendri TaxID=2728024 RepID=A0A7L5DLT7_9BACT|nr:glycosyltransferase family 2 protein [Spirosoma rhododendri]QJD79376.1 glycosyltransferase family 2 protein [Spirosoma rhododendri]